MRFSFLSVLLIFFIGPSRPARCQELSSLDPDIATVVSGGSWTTADGHGVYRVIVRTFGFEHIVSDLTLQWIRDPEGPKAAADRVTATIVRSVRLEPQCPGRLDEPVLSKRDQKWRLTVRCTPTIIDGKRTNVVFDLGAPGEYSEPGRK